MAQLTQRYVPRMSFNPVELTALLTRKRLANAKAKLVAICIEKMWDFTHAEMAKLQQTQIKKANKHQKNSLKYKVKDKFWLSIRNIHTKKPSKKLDHKKIDLYPIKKIIDLLYRLELPTSIQIHDVFYSNLLKLAAGNLLPNQINDFPHSVVVNKKEK